MQNDIIRPAFTFRKLLYIYISRFKDWNPRYLKELGLILERNASSINLKDQYGFPPLNLVLFRKNCPVDVVNLFLNYGADVNCRQDRNQNTPLHVALIRQTDDAVIRVLLDKGADVKAQDKYGKTSLCHALGNNASIDVLKLLLEGGCHPNGCRGHVSALECVSEAPAKDGLKEGVLDMLIEGGANVLRAGRNGQSPICFALRAGAGLGDIQQLLRLGASLDACRSHSSMWLCATDFQTEFYQMSRVWGEFFGMRLKADVLQLLRTARAPVDSVNEDGYTPLQLALKYCNYQTRAIKLLIDLPGVDCGVKDEESRNLLHLAVENVHCKRGAVKILIGRGVKVDELNRTGQTPLRVAIDRCTFGVAELLLSSGSPVNVVDVKYFVSNTPLRIAVMNQRG